MTVDMDIINEIMGGTDNASGPYGLHRSEVIEIIEGYIDSPRKVPQWTESYKLGFKFGYNTAKEEHGHPYDCKALDSSDQDCNWPLCGCDPYADKVIATFAESYAPFDTEEPLDYETLKQFYISIVGMA